MDDRLVYLLVGCVIGFVVGYVVRSLRDIDEKVTEVDEYLLHKHDDKDDDRGWVVNEWLQRVALLLVVAMTVYFAFQSQWASNKVRDQQKSQDRNSACTQLYLNNTIVALNARTAYSIEQNNANVQLQKAQLAFLNSLSHPSANTKDYDHQALTKYMAALTTYTSFVSKSAGQVTANAYPSPEDFIKCIKG